MPEKGQSLLPASTPWTLWSSPLHQWRFGVLTALVFLGMLAVWSIDGCSVKSFVEAWRFNQSYVTLKVKAHASVNLGYTLRNLSQTHHNLTHTTPDSSQTRFNLTRKQENASRISAIPPELQLPASQISGVVPGNRTETRVKSSVDWVLVELESDLTSNLLARWLAPGGEPCKESRTEEITIPALDGRNLVELSAGDVHEFVFQALDGTGKPLCLGGDYFETDLSGESWKSRPVVKDLGNGSYSVSLQVHPDFSGEYTLTIILLFRHFEGLKFSPPRFAYNRELRRIPIRFSKSAAKMPDLETCKGSDFGREVWAGRWTRHGKNDDCQIGNDGRYRCLPPDFPCASPWCTGSLGSLESNGWVYSAHCSFRLFSADSAWKCLKNRWVFFWGDSNHVDTIRNMLNFVLDLPEIHAVPRRFDMNFSNPIDPSQTVRITSIFNGHWNETQNYQGLNSLKDEGFRNLLKRYFSEDTVPDTVIMNSGLHDGVFWSNIRAFSGGAAYGAKFWAEVLESVRRRGLKVPRVLYRNTVATGGYARTLGFNPSKMEAFNWVFLDKLKQAGVVSSVIDNFDMTFPWHFDNRCNDGVHYGRAPAKMKWRDGEIGHQYFVDLMLCHVLLNALCQA